MCGHRSLLQWDSTERVHGTLMRGSHHMMRPMDTLERLLSVQDLANYLGVPVATIYAWRHRGHGPRGFRAGRHLRFRTSDVTEWITQHIDQDNHHPTRGM